MDINCFALELCSSKQSIRTNGHGSADLIYREALLFLCWLAAQPQILNAPNNS